MTSDPRAPDGPGQKHNSADDGGEVKRRASLDVLQLARSCQRSALHGLILSLLSVGICLAALLWPIPEAPRPFLAGWGDEVIRLGFCFFGLLGAFIAVWQPGKDVLNIRAWAGAYIPGRDLRRVLLPALRRIAETDRARNQIKTAEVHAGVGRVLEAATRMIAGFRQDPEDIHRSQSVLGRLLPSVLDLTKTFPQLEARSTDADGLQKTIASTSQTLAVIAQTFDRRDQDNLFDNFQRVSVELATLHRLAGVSNPSDRLL